MQLIKIEDIPDQIPQVDCIHDNAERAMHKVTVDRETYNLCSYHLLDFLRGTIEAIQDTL